MQVGSGRRALGSLRLCHLSTLDVDTATLGWPRREKSRAPFLSLSSLAAAPSAAHRPEEPSQELRPLPLPRPSPALSKPRPGRTAGCQPGLCGPLLSTNTAARLQPTGTALCQHKVGPCAGLVRRAVLLLPGMEPRACACRTRAGPLSDIPSPRQNVSFTKSDSGQPGPGRLGRQPRSHAFSRHVSHRRFAVLASASPNQVEPPSFLGYPPLALFRLTPDCDDDEGTDIRFRSAPGQPAGSSGNQAPQLLLILLPQEWIRGAHRQCPRTPAICSCS